MANKRITYKGDVNLKLGKGYIIPPKSSCLISEKIYKNFAFSLEKNKNINIMNYYGKDFSEDFKVL